MFNVITDRSFFPLDTHFAGSTASVVDERGPITLINSRRVAEWLLRRFWQVLAAFYTFPIVNDSVKLIESIFIPEILFFDIGPYIYYKMQILQEIYNFLDSCEILVLHD